MLLTILLCIMLVGVDQLIKNLAAHYLAPVGSAPLLPGVIELSYTENTGAAFNLLAGRQMLLVVLTGVALLVGAYVLLFRRPKLRLELIAIIMVFSGGVGNLIDRIANGYVVDYFRLLFMNFAIFNFADLLITVGFALLVLAVLRAESRSKKQAAQAKTAIDGDLTAPLPVENAACKGQNQKEPRESPYPPAPPQANGQN